MAPLTRDDHRLSKEAESLPIGRSVEDWLVNEEATSRHNYERKELGI
jgi:hypothetical protein